MDHETKQHYNNWLQSQEWTYFFTGTFREEFTPNGAHNAVQRFFNRKENKPELGFIVIEKGSMYGRVHTHGVLRYPEKGIFQPAGSLWQRWFEQYGRGKVETIRSQPKVSGYVSKYITKDIGGDSWIIV